MQIEAKTQINYEAYRKYYLFNFLQGRRSPWQARLLIILSPILFIAFFIYYLRDPADIINVIGMVVMLILGVALLLILYILPRRYYRKDQQHFEIPVHYIFTDQHFTAALFENGETGQDDSQEGERTDPVVVPYDLVSRVYETREFFYIYVSRSQIYLIGKADIFKGSADELREFFQSKMNNRFLMI